MTLSTFPSTSCPSTISVPSFFSSRLLSAAAGISITGFCFAPSYYLFTTSVSACFISGSASFKTSYCFDSIGIIPDTSSFSGTSETVEHGAASYTKLLLLNSFSFMLSDMLRSEKDMDSFTYTLSHLSSTFSEGASMDSTK